MNSEEKITKMLSVVPPELIKKVTKTMLSIFESDGNEIAGIMVATDVNDEKNKSVLMTVKIS